MHSLSVVYGWGLLGETVYVSQQPTLIKIDFCVSKCMLSIWLQAQEKKTKDTSAAEIIHINLNTLQCHLDPAAIIILSRSPPPSKRSKCNWWRHSGEGWEGSIKRRHPNSSQLIHAALHSPHHPWAPSLSPPSCPPPPQRHRWAWGAWVLVKAKQCARVLNYFSSSALSSRRGNQFSFGQQ